MCSDYNTNLMNHYLHCQTHRASLLKFAEKTKWFWLDQKYHFLELRFCEMGHRQTHQEATEKSLVQIQSSRERHWGSWPHRNIWCKWCLVWRNFWHRPSKGHRCTRPSIVRRGGQTSYHCCWCCCCCICQEGSNVPTPTYCGPHRNSLGGNRWRRTSWVRDACGGGFFWQCRERKRENMN